MFDNKESLLVASRLCHIRRNIERRIETSPNCHFIKVYKGMFLETNG